MNKFTIRNEVDFIALAPVMLGFQPAHSLVMMTVNSFHARLDVPDEANIPAAVDALLAPTKRHGVSQVAFIIFDDREHDELKTVLLNDFRAAGIEVVAAVEVRDEQYRQFYGEWMPLDLAHHPLTLDAQFHDIAPQHRTREELEEYVRPCGAESSKAIADSLALLRSCDDLAYVLEALNRESAKASMGLWTRVLRSCEPGDEIVTEVAVVLAIASWLNGDGARAWVAVDHIDKESGWHELISTILERAIHPDEWDDMQAYL